MEADRIALPFQHGTLQIVVEQDARNTTKHLERLGVAAQEVLHAGIEAEVQEELPRIAQHHHERHQRPPRAADLDAAKMAPVDQGLFAWQAAQTQIGLGSMQTSGVCSDLDKLWAHVTRVGWWRS